MNTEYGSKKILIKKLYPRIYVSSGTDGYTVRKVKTALAAGTRSGWVIAVSLSA